MLNALKKRDSYPILCMDECIDSLGEATIFSALDADSGYWQIKFDELDQDKTAQASHHGLCHFNRTPFGLQEAQGTFRRTIDAILFTKKWEIADVYLDDVFVFSGAPKEQIFNVQHVFTLRNNARDTLKLKTVCS